MFVVGTAGHVDHGKSTLVKALTGIDPDRLREERERAMTIELGFAWMTLPSGREISIVDVPGHERFIKNMLAGVGGIDAALLVIAADEGPMPQTLEHLAILDLLGIDRGLIVLTKRDAVDADWLAMIGEETRECVAGSTLAEAPLVAVSALTGEGLGDLQLALDRLFDSTPPRAITGKPRLPIDRVFTIAGFGTVVTGTLSDGPLEVGQEVEIVPSGRRGRVRGLQAHRNKVREASPGSRVAVNVSGLAVDQLRRGDLLTVPGWLRPTDRIDGRLVLTRDAPVEINQNDEVDFFLGADELTARVSLLDSELLRPGEQGWVQFRLARPLAAVKGDRFIVRRPSPSATLGGGVVINAFPRRHKRFHAATIKQLNTLERGSPEELVLQALSAGPLDLKSLGQATGLATPTLTGALERLVAEARATILAGELGGLRPSDVVISTAAWTELLERQRGALAAFHARFQLRAGMPKEEFRGRLGLAPRYFDAVISAALRQGELLEEAGTVRLPAHTISLSTEQRASADRFLDALRARPFAPPAPAEFGVTPELVTAMTALGEVVRIDDAVVFDTAAYRAIVTATLDVLASAGTITVADFRDRFGSSRKYALAVLEHFDRLHLTRRVGDERVRGTASAPADIETVTGVS